MLNRRYYEDRSLLHYTKLNEFLTWVLTEEYEILTVKGKYEVFRLKKSNELIIGYKRNKTDHITVYGQGLTLVRKFLRIIK